MCRQIQCKTEDNDLYNHKGKGGLICLPVRNKIILLFDCQCLQIFRISTVLLVLFFLRNLNIAIGALLRIMKPYKINSYITKNAYTSLSTLILQSLSVLSVS